MALHRLLRNTVSFSTVGYEVFPDRPHRFGDYALTASSYLFSAAAGTVCQLALLLQSLTLLRLVLLALLGLDKPWARDARCWRAD